MKFDLSKIRLSNNDIKRGLVLPGRPSKKLAEFIGVLIGDGYLYNNKNQHTIGVVGNPRTDMEYFHKIQNLIFVLFNLQTKIKVGGRGLRLVFGSKGVFNFITKVVGLEYGKNKGQRVKIPHFFIKENEFITDVIRGVFDTDGTIFTSDKKGLKQYPCIELTTTSISLAEQVKRILSSENFRVAGVRKYKYKHSFLISNKVSLYGKKNILLWFKKIGFSNPLKQNKLLEILNGDAGI